MLHFVKIIDTHLCLLPLFRILTQPIYTCFLALANQYIVQAKMLIGATLLVTKDDRPELEEGEFYTHDLIGMRVFMKVCSYHKSCVYMKTNHFTSPYSLFKLLLKRHLFIHQFFFCNFVTPAVCCCDRNANCLPYNLYSSMKQDCSFSIEHFSRYISECSLSLCTKDPANEMPTANIVIKMKKATINNVYILLC